MSWTTEDESACLGPDGWLTAPLTVYVHGAAVTKAATAAFELVGLAVGPASRTDVLLVDNASRPDQGRSRSPALDASLSERVESSGGEIPHTSGVQRPGTEVLPPANGLGRAVGFELSGPMAAWQPGVDDVSRRLVGSPVRVESLVEKPPGGAAFRLRVVCSDPEVYLSDVDIAEAVVLLSDCFAWQVLTKLHETGSY